MKCSSAPLNWSRVRGCSVRTSCIRHLLHLRGAIENSSTEDEADQRSPFGVFGFADERVGSRRLVNLWMQQAREEGCCGVEDRAEERVAAAVDGLLEQLKRRAVDDHRRANLLLSPGWGDGGEFLGDDVEKLAERSRMLAGGDVDDVGHGAACSCSGCDSPGSGLG